jgi:hypothetical protein
VIKNKIDPKMVFLCHNNQCQSASTP